LITNINNRTEDENSDSFSNIRGRSFEPSAKEGHLTYTLPDLSAREETFLKQQIRIDLKPDCLQKEHVEGKFCPFSQILGPLAG
jgi:hypothetical protein